MKPELMDAIINSINRIDRFVENEFKIISESHDFKIEEIVSYVLSMLNTVNSSILHGIARGTDMEDMIDLKLTKEEFFNHIKVELFSRLKYTMID